MRVEQGGNRSLASQRELWSLVKARREAVRFRQEGRNFVAERLGSLLLGQNLDPAEQAEYVRRLAGTSAQAAELEQGPQVPDLSRARIARDLLLCKAGGVGWRLFPISTRAVVVSPLQRRLQERLAVALKDKLGAAPESARTCIHAVGITLDRGPFTTPWHDEDRVEMTGWGMEILTLQGSLRSAPRLPPPPAILLANVGPSG